MKMLYQAYRLQCFNLHPFTIMFLTYRAHNIIVKFTTASPTAYPIVIQRLICTASNKGEEEIAVTQLPRLHSSFNIIHIILLVKLLIFPNTAYITVIHKRPLLQYYHMLAHLLHQEQFIHLCTN
jgi:hypothetical protein